MIYFRHSNPRLLVLLTIILVVTSSSFAVAQRRGAHADDESPLFQEYRSVKIGMTTDEVRKKLSDPSDKSDEQDFFVFGENESAQVFYDKTHKVFAISINFLNGAQNMPTPKVILGSELAAKADGSMYKMVRYPKAGFWVSFSRTAGDSPLTTVTLQRID
ncbi:MAG: hypothetical protein ACRD8U_06175 [Pyrinomonadaceae bacterium]